MNTYVCPKCGNEVNINSRCCMKCGCLNPNHPENDKYKQYMNGTGNYTVTSGTTVLNDTNVKTVNGGLGNKAGNSLVCFIINLLFYVVSVGLILFLSYYVSGSLKGLLNPELYYLLFAVTIFSIFNYSQQLVYMKMNKHWLTALIPLVNLYSLSDAINHNIWLNLLIFVPVIGQIYYIVLLFQLGRSFKKSGLFTMLFPIIMTPIIGYDESNFNGIYYASKNNTLESDYKNKSRFLKINIFVLICCIIMTIYTNISGINSVINNDNLKKNNKLYLYYVGKRVVQFTKMKVDTNTYRCDNNSKTLYFYYKDISNYIDIPLYNFNKPIDAYVKVVIIEEGNFYDEFHYYVSLTDGTYGFSEIEVNQLKLSSITDYTSLNKSDNVNLCYFNT